MDIYINFTLFYKCFCLSNPIISEVRKNTESNEFAFFVTKKYHHKMIVSLYIKKNLLYNNNIHTKFQNNITVLSNLYIIYY